MIEHVCRCRSCDPEYFPTGPVQGPAHFAIRFNARHHLLSVLVDGVEHKYCTEVMAGPDGWIIENVQPTHLCRWCQSRVVCEQRRVGVDVVVYGEVRARRV